MGGYADKLQNKASEVMRPNERLLAAVRTAPSGSTTGMAVGGLIGAAVASKAASKANAAAGQNTLASTWPSGQAALGLTDQRLLTFNYTALGKPKDLTAEFPLESVASIDLEKKKITNALKIAFTDGSTAVVECKKLEKTDELLEAFRATKSGAR